MSEPDAILPRMLIRALNLRDQRPLYSRNHRKDHTDSEIDHLADERPHTHGCKWCTETWLCPSVPLLGRCIDAKRHRFFGAVCPACYKTHQGAVGVRRMVLGPDKAEGSQPAKSIYHAERRPKDYRPNKPKVIPATCSDPTLPAPSPEPAPQPPSSQPTQN